MKMKIVHKETLTYYKEPVHGFCCIDPKDKESMEKIEVEAIIMDGGEEEPDHRYVMTLAGSKGGPVISGPTIDDTIVKFAEAWKVCLAVGSLINFSIKEGHDPYAVKEKFSD